MGVRLLVRTDLRNDKDKRSLRLAQEVSNDVSRPVISHLSRASPSSTNTSLNVAFNWKHRTCCPYFPMRSPTSLICRNPSRINSKRSLTVRWSRFHSFERFVLARSRQRDLLIHRSTGEYQHADHVRLVAWPKLLSTLCQPFVEKVLSCIVQHRSANYQ